MSNKVWNGGGGQSHGDKEVGALQISLYLN